VFGFQSYTIIQPLQQDMLDNTYQWMHSQIVIFPFIYSLAYQLIKQQYFKTEWLCKSIVGMAV